MILAGYVGAPAWVVLFGLLGVWSEGWWPKLRQSPRAPWSTKTKAYFISGIGANVVLSAVAYFAGRLARALLD